MSIVASPAAVAAAPAALPAAAPEAVQADDSDEDIMDDDKGFVLPTFEYGVDDDPLEYFWKVESANLGRSVPSSTTRGTQIMDMVRKGCCRFLQRTIGKWASPGGYPGGGEGVVCDAGLRQARRSEQT